MTLFLEAPCLVEFNADEYASTVLEYINEVARLNEELLHASYTYSIALQEGKDGALDRAFILLKVAYRYAIQKVSEIFSNIFSYLQYGWRRLISGSGPINVPVDSTITIQAIFDDSLTIIKSASFIFMNSPDTSSLALTKQEISTLHNKITANQAKFDRQFNKEAGTYTSVSVSDFLTQSLKINKLVAQQRMLAKLQQEQIQLMDSIVGTHDDRTPEFKAQLMKESIDEFNKGAKAIATVPMMLNKLIKKFASTQGK